ncbi:Transposase [Balamuthia mandrillaris]
MEAFAAEDLSMELQQRIRQLTASIEQKKEPLLRFDYLGAETVERLAIECRKAIASENPQSRQFIAVVQATLSGKTRLLLELVYKILDVPVIMIRLFMRSNLTYAALVNSISQYNAQVELLPFAERRDHNRRIILKIRIFFYCYMLFTKEFMRLHNRDNWREVSLEERRIFNGLLLNGGTEMLRKLLLKEFSKRRVDEPDTNLIQAKLELAQALEEIAVGLGQPWFVLDECHTPQQYCKGFLFHSDYTNHPPDQVIEWQQWEMSQEGRGVPEGYPYLSKTDLFWAFRWVACEFLTKSLPQLTIFTSTQFSAWQPLLDATKVSRERPSINKFYLHHELTVEEMIHSLRELLPDSTAQQLQSLLNDWRGRPGFFFEFLFPKLSSVLMWSQSSGEGVLETIQACAEEAREAVHLFVQNQIKEYALRHSTQRAASAQQLLKLVQFSLLLRHGHLSGTGSEFVAVVETGYARVTKYSLDKGRVDAFISDPLVEESLLYNRTEALDNAEHYLVDQYTANHGELAEYAIAHRLLRLHSTTLADLIANWCSVIQLPRNQVFEKATIQALSAGHVDDYGIDSAEILCFSNLVGRVLLGKSGLRLPDILFTAVTNSVIVLCSVQVKTRIKRLAASKFMDAIRSTSRDWFLRGKSQDVKQHTKLQSLWENQLQQLPRGKSVCHLRFVVSWAGFTQAQVDLINSFNAKNPEQLILLVQPALTAVGDFIYGTRCNNVTTTTTSTPPPSKQHNENLRYVAPAELIERYGISHSGLVKCHKAGKVAALVTPGGHHRYAAEHVREILGLRDPEAPQKIKALYCRVSSHHQHEHLQHQIESLREAYPHHQKVYSDIGSGINWTGRKGFLSLLDAVLEGTVEEVVVAHRDRLCRVAFELLEHIFRKRGTRLLVHSSHDGEEDGAEPANVLAEDLMSREATRRRQKGKGRAGRKKPKATIANENDKGKEKEKEEEEDEEVELKTRKIRLRPNKEQSQILNRWFGGARKVWNATLHELKEERIGWYLKEMQRVCVVEPLHPIPDYLNEVPYSIRHETVKQLHSNHATCMTLKEQGHIRRFSIKKKRKKDRRTQSIAILGQYLRWWKGLIYPDLLHLNPAWAGTNETNKGRKHRLRNPHPKHSNPLFDPIADAFEGLEVDERGRLKRTCTLHKNRRGHFWLCVPIPIQHHARAPENQGSIVALDPGVRTFMCGYSPTEGTVREFGRNDFGRLWRLNMHADALQSKVDR